MSGYWWGLFDVIFIVAASIAFYKYELCVSRRSIAFPMFLVPLVSIALSSAGAAMFAGCCAVFYLSYRSGRTHNASRWVKITLLFGAALCCLVGIEYILYYEYVVKNASLYYLYSELMALVMLSLLFAFVFPNGIGANEFRQYFSDYWFQFRWRISRRGSSSVNKVQKLSKGKA